MSGSGPIRVMIERGKKKTVASAFDWPGWDRGAKTEHDALAVLAAYQPRYARVAEVAGLADELGAAGETEVVERVQGTGSTDFYTLSVRSAAPYHLLDHAWEMEDRDLSGHAASG